MASSKKTVHLKSFCVDQDFVKVALRQRKREKDEK